MSRRPQPMILIGGLLKEIRGKRLNKMREKSVYIYNTRRKEEERRKYTEAAAAPWVVLDLIS